MMRLRPRSARPFPRSGALLAADGLLNQRRIKIDDAIAEAGLCPRTPVMLLVRVKDVTLLRQAIAAKEWSAGAEDPGLARLLSEYSNVLRATGRFSEAEMAQVRATKIKVRNAIRNNS